MSYPAASPVEPRHCSRPGCSEPGAVTLTYQYARSQVWLDELAVEREPHAYDLCADHAARLSAPLGWHVFDRRRPLTTITRLAG